MRIGAARALLQPWLEIGCELTVARTWRMRSAISLASSVERHNHPVGVDAKAGAPERQTEERDVQGADTRRYRVRQGEVAIPIERSSGDGYEDRNAIDGRDPQGCRESWDSLVDGRGQTVAAAHRPRFDLERELGTAQIDV